MSLRVCLQPGSRPRERVHAARHGLLLGARHEAAKANDPRAAAPHAALRGLSDPRRRRLRRPRPLRDLGQRPSSRAARARPPSSAARPTTPRCGPPFDAYFGSADRAYECSGATPMLPWLRSRSRGARRLPLERASLELLRRPGGGARPLPRARRGHDRPGSLRRSRALRRALLPHRCRRPLRAAPGRARALRKLLGPLPLEIKGGHPLPFCCSAAASWSSANPRAARSWRARPRGRRGRRSRAGERRRRRCRCRPR